MTDKDLEKLIDEMSDEYAKDNEEFPNEETWITNYFDLKIGFIDGFKAGLNFKEERK